MEMHQIRYFLAVCQELNFTRAAEACHVAQPSLSAQVALAERLLGVRVFERDRRHVRLSPAGEALVQQARRVLVAASDLRDLAQQFSDPFHGSLRLGVIPTLGPYILPEIVPALARTFPHLTLLWSEERTGVLMRILRRFEPAPMPISFVHAGQGRLPLKLRAFLDFAAPRLRARLDFAAPLARMGKDLTPRILADWRRRIGRSAARAAA